MASSLSTEKLAVGGIGLSLAVLSGMVVSLGVNAPVGGSVDAAALLLFVGAWAVGMVAMMLPSLLPMILVVVAAAKQNHVSSSQSSAAHRASQSIQFVLSYFGTWSLVGLAAYFGLVSLFRYYPPFSAAGQLAGLAGGIAIFLAGVYQLSPLKQRALRACRSPMAFIMNRWRGGLFGALWMGLDYGFFCTKCCWAFMAVLVVVGAMNLLWMVLFAGAIFVEKVVPHGVGVSKGLGILLMAAGAFLAVAPS